MLVNYIPSTWHQSDCVEQDVKTGGTWTWNVQHKSSFEIVFIVRQVKAWTQFERIADRSHGN